MKCIYYYSYLLLISAFLSTNEYSAQQINHNNEFWAGYISSSKLSNRFALWNDVHMVPQSFFAYRNGLTYSLTKNFDVTAGYAWVTTATSFSTKLIRDEHRPWGQVIGRFTLQPKITYQVRFRYDARFRRELEFGNSLGDDFLFYNRLRFFSSVRFKLKRLPNDKILHLNILEEYLINAGKNAPNLFDQNRTFVMLGITKNQYTIQAGYHLRILPQGANGYRFNHGATIWFIHNLDLRWGKKNTTTDTVDELL
jgi:hypothetical protein